MGVVHHSNYIRWFEEARTDILEQAGFGYNHMEELGIISPVLEVSAQYRSMTRYPETVRIETKVTEYNGIRMTLKYTVKDKITGEVRCIGTSRHCFLDHDGKLLKITQVCPEIDDVIAGLLSDSEEE
jgi:acyl-CoA thioester hydrolase